MLITALVSLCTTLALAQPASPPQAPAATIQRLLTDEFDAAMEASPVWASVRGDERWNDQLGDESLAAIERRREATRARLTALQTIDLSTLSEGDRLNAELLRRELDLAVEGAKFHPEQLPIDDRNSPMTWLLELPQRVPLRTEKHYADYVKRLEAVPTLIAQLRENMQAGLKAGRVPPKTAVQSVVRQARAMAKDLSADPAASPLFRPLAGRAEADPLITRAKASIGASTPAALAAFADFLESDYVPHCRDSTAARDSVDGLDWYNFRLRQETTTDMTADQIHDLGLKEVARIKAEMFRVIATSDFAQKDTLKGDELFRAFVAHLRTDPRFYFTNPRELLQGYRDIAKRIDAELPRLFRTLPRNPYGVGPIPMVSAPAQTTAYYQPGSLKGGIPGYFMANTYALDQRPKYEMISLTLHEAMPGHHLQIAIADELSDVHPYRTTLGFTAFVEGWALYAERLGMEMSGPIRRETDDTVGRGLFTDPYDDFGRLTYEMWRACRLVVDTGLHAKGWSRQQAIDFMNANTALSTLNIEREVDRYIAWPGQACAYKIGELKIRELRAKAEAALGDKFDLREFHDVVLGAGALPLDVLEARANRWMAATAPAPK